MLARRKFGERVKVKKQSGAAGPKLNNPAGLLSGERGGASFHNLPLETLE